MHFNEDILDTVHAVNPDVFNFSDLLIMYGESFTMTTMLVVYVMFYVWDIDGKKEQIKNLTEENNKLKREHNVTK